MIERQVKQNSTLLLYSPCDELKKKFYQLKTAQDVAELLEVSYSRLIYHIYKVKPGNKYKEFYVPKRSGQPRTISAPSSTLKILQRKLSQVLYSTYEPKVPVHGFVVNRNILTNAKVHQRRKFVLNLDLKDFFCSIHFGRVRGIFMAPPYKLPSEVATVLAQICCHLNQLPQGAPTSPIVSNMICARLDSQLRSLAQESRCSYTRYADDITFSTNLSKFPVEIAQVSETEINEKSVVVGEKLLRTISNNGFELNEEKLRLQHRSQHQSVTGLTVNQFPNVSRRYIRGISSMLHAWEKFGLDSAQERYNSILQSEKEEFETRISSELPNEMLSFLDKKERPLFHEVVRGKINFIGMVRGKDDHIFQKYRLWFQSLLKRDLTIN